MFDVYVNKGNDKKMEKVEEEITRLEDELEELKLEAQVEDDLPPYY